MDSKDDINNSNNKKNTSNTENESVNKDVLDIDTKQFENLKYHINSTDDSINRLSVSIEEHKNNQSWVSNKFMDLDKKMVTIINFDNVLLS